ncbi:MAG: DUF5668 domain-containing protein [Patescibacteria group bacterium]
MPENNKDCHDHKTFFGIILIGLGILFLLQNFGWFYMNWRNVGRLWPLLLILLGLSSLRIDRTLQWVLFALVILAALAFLMFPGYQGTMMMRWGP